MSVAVWREPAEVPADLEGTAVTVGVFDGVHRGHQVVVGRVAKLARNAGLIAVAVTFDPNPLAVIRPEIAPRALLPLARRVELLHAAGADHVLVLPFDRERAQQPAEEFVDDVLVGLLGVEVIAVGLDFRFGHKAAGDVALLERMGAERGFSVETVGAVGGDAMPRWSSTHIRELVGAGDVAAAAGALGRPFRVEGVVVRGAGRGRNLGFPTANIPVVDGQLVPAEGVYAGRLTRLDQPGASAMPSAISVGTNPTFGGDVLTVEPYVLDRDDLALYDAPVAVDFVDRIRGQERFDSVDDLVARMREDVAATRRALGT